MQPPIFHLAFPVNDLIDAENFYVNLLGAKVGRRRERWIDIYLFGGQITLHEQPDQVLPEEQCGFGTLARYCAGLSGSRYLRGWRNKASSSMAGQRYPASARTWNRPNSI